MFLRFQKAQKKIPDLERPETNDFSMRASKQINNRSKTHTHFAHLSPHCHTCNVPQLESDHRVTVPLQHLQGEVHADGCAVMLGEDLVHVALDDGGLAHAEVPDDQHLEEELLLLHAAAPHASINKQTNKQTFGRMDPR